MANLLRGGPGRAEGVFQGWRPPQKSIAADAGGRAKGGGDGSGSALKTPQPDDAKEEDGGGDLARDSGWWDVRVGWVGGRLPN